jgi:hypothetical protein
MQHRNIPYEYNEWTTWNGKQASGYSCEYFNFHPYHIQSFSTELEQDMIHRIDDYLDNRATYEYRRKLSDASNQAYYDEKSKTPGAYTGD